ncbi:MAG TPA: hypothetical protein VK604_22135, partial [Bryobacteraceae bacterium]|nr:hypothetical protein [Bryobacteraceae bacterium]
MKRMLLGLAIALQALAQAPVTVVLVNGKIWTANPNQPEAEAVALRGNRIAAVGSTAEILHLKGPET